MGEGGVVVDRRAVTRARSRKKALVDHISGLRVLGLGARVVDVLERQIELVFVMLRIAAIFRAAASTRQRFTLWASQTGTTRSLMRSAAVIGVLRS